MQQYVFPLTLNNTKLMDDRCCSSSFVTSWSKSWRVLYKIASSFKNLPFKKPWCSPCFGKTEGLNFKRPLSQMFLDISPKLSKQLFKALPVRACFCISMLLTASRFYQTSMLFHFCKHLSTIDLEMCQIMNISIN